MFCVLLHSSQSKAGTFPDKECYKKEMQPMEEPCVIVTHYLFSIYYLGSMFHGQLVSKDNRHKVLTPLTPNLLLLLFLNKTVHLYYSGTLEDTQVDIKPAADGISKDILTRFFVYTYL